MASPIPRRFPFAQEYQEKLIGLMVNSMEGAALIPVVRPEYFELPVHRRIMRVLGAVVRKLKLGVTWSILRSALKQHSSSEEYKAARAICRKLAAISLTVAERAYILEEVGRFCKLQAIGNALIESVDLYRAQNLDGLDTLWNGTLQVGRSLIDDGFDVLGTFEQRHTALVAQTTVGKPIRTMIGPLDRQFLFGGAVPPSLNVLVGMAGHGKTMFCVHAAAAAVAQGKKVCYITNDMAASQIAMRFDSRFSNVPMADLLVHWPKARKALQSKLDQWGEVLRVKYLPPDEGTVADIAHYLGLLDARGFHTDLLIVDYADQLGSRRRGPRDDNRYYELGNVYVELQKMMNERDLVVWTVSQAVRAGTQKPLLMIDDIAECVAEHSLIATATGYRPIEALAVGDLVLTHRGRFRPIVAVMDKGIKLVAPVKVDGLPPLWVTDNHPFFVPDSKEWVEASKLSGARVLSPNAEITEEYAHTLVGLPVEPGRGRPPKGMTLEIPVTEDVAEVLGWLTAEGCVAKTSPVVTGSFHSREWKTVLRYKAILESTFGIEWVMWTRENRGEIRASSILLNAFMGALLGVGSPQKHVPQFIWTSPRSVREAYVRGVLAGDGWRSGNVECLTMHNQRLVWDISLLISMLGRPYSLSLYDGYRHPGGWNAAPGAILRISSGREADYHRRAVLNGWSARAQSFGAVREPRRVFDLMVDEDSSFVAHGLAVHNSFKKIMIADFVVTFNQTPDEKAKNQARLFIAKNRMERAYAVIPIGTAFDRARFYDPHATPAAQPYRLLGNLIQGGFQKGGSFSPRKRKIGATKP